MSKQTLKKGDQVVMHTCMEHDHPDNFGKIWTCRSDEFQHKGHDYGSVFLEGFSGSFSTEYLQLVDLPGVIKRLKEENERLQSSNDLSWKATTLIQQGNADLISKNHSLMDQLQDALNTLNEIALMYTFEPTTLHSLRVIDVVKQAIDRLQGQEVIQE